MRLILRRGVAACCTQPRQLDNPDASRCGALLASPWALHLRRHASIASGCCALIETSSMSARKYLHCLQLLLQRGANINLEVDGMGTPLHAAAAHGACTAPMLLH